MIELKVTADKPEVLFAQVLALAHLISPRGEALPVEQEHAELTTAAEKVVEKAAEPVADKAPAVAEEKPKKGRAKKEEKPAEATGPTEDDVRDGLVKLVQAKGEEVAFEVLRTYGAEKVSGIPKDKLADALADINEALEA